VGRSTEGEEPFSFRRKDESREASPEGKRGGKPTQSQGEKGEGNQKINHDKIIAFFTPILWRS